LTVFVDSSTWFAATVVRDRDNARAKAVLSSAPALVTTDHILVETWLLLKSRFHRAAAERFWERIRHGGVHVEIVTGADLEAAWSIGAAFPDQDFSIVDRTCFAVMERLGLTRVASLDDHFAIYRYGRNRDRAFDILR
jgi:predicted nucleic acid-binding protein